MVSLMPASPAGPAGAPARTLRWIPIRSLAPRHKPRLLTHLLALPEHDRYLRFGYAATDEQITRYVNQLNFDRDEIFGIFDRRLRLIATAHLAYSGPQSSGQAAEFGVSVLPKARGRGLGGRLFDRAVLHARNRHIDTLVVHALSENGTMLRIARAAGAVVQRDGPDAEAQLKLPRDTLATQMEALLERQAAEFDYNWKFQARRVNRLLGLMAGHRSAEAD